MKRVICLILTCLMVSVLALPVLAAPAAPVITMQPQSPNYPEYSVAIYTVKAEGTNLTATWYMQWQEKTYTISNIGGAMQAWEPFAGESYGAKKLDNNTFTFVFEGIEYDLDGAYIWCVLEDGHYDVTSQKTRISVGNSNTPPEIVSIPAMLTLEQGAAAELHCVAKAPDGTQLSFLWYETDTGKREDIRAVNRGTETTDTLLCDTANLGTRNYLCMVESSDGGLTYSSLVPVTVIEKKAAENTPTEPSETTPATNEPTKPQPSNPTNAATNTQEPADTQTQQNQKGGISWWSLVIVAVVAAGAGVGIAVVLVRKKA